MLVAHAPDSFRSVLARDTSNVAAGAGPYLALGTALLPLLGFLYVIVEYDAGLGGRGYLATEISVPSLALIGARALLFPSLIVAIATPQAILLRAFLRSQTGSSPRRMWSRAPRAFLVGAFFGALFGGGALFAFSPGWPASFLQEVGFVEIFGLIVWSVLAPGSGRFRNLWWLFAVGLIALTIAAGLSPRGPAASGRFHFIASSGAAPADGRYAEVARSDSWTYLQPCGQTDVIAVSDSVIGYVDEERAAGPSPKSEPSLFDILLRRAPSARPGYAPC